MAHDSVFTEAMCFDVDRPKMAQVLRNFLSNALKFTAPESTVLICVRFSHVADFIERRKKMKAVTSSPLRRGLKHMRRKLHRTMMSLRVRKHAKVLAMNSSSSSSISSSSLSSVADIPQVICRIEVRDCGPGIKEVTLL